MKQIVPVVENERAAFEKGDAYPALSNHSGAPMNRLRNLKDRKFHTLADQGEQSEDVIADAVGVGEVLAGGMSDGRRHAIERLFHEMGLKGA
nr:hypothetical protein [Mesorhizobium sp. SARCC-RB16n]